jgi:hypothetical protein
MHFVWHCWFLRRQIIVEEGVTETVFGNEALEPDTGADRDGVPAGLQPLSQCHVRLDVPT